MSSLNQTERRTLEKLFIRDPGYVLNFSNKTFDDFVLDYTNKDIRSSTYAKNGESKANRLRAFWEIESDYIAGELTQKLIEYAETLFSEENPLLIKNCKDIAQRLLSGKPIGEHLSKSDLIINSAYISAQYKRMMDSSETDPDLAIGTSKELLETCCKQILSERGIPYGRDDDIHNLTKKVFKALHLVPEEVDNSKKGSELIKRILSNLVTIGAGIAELRGLYGTGHGREGSSKGLTPRHAKLAIGTTTTLVYFLFETHKHSLDKPN